MKFALLRIRKKRNWTESVTMIIRIMSSYFMTLRVFAARSRRWLFVRAKWADMADPISENPSPPG